MAVVRRLGLYLAVVLCVSANALQAAPTGEALARILRIDALAQALHDEGIDHAKILDADILGGRGGAHWGREVARIYDVDRIAGAIRAVLSDDLGEDEAIQTAAFFDSSLGQEILSLEIAARVSMRDADVEAAARAAHDGLKGTGDPRLALVNRFVTVNDLVERNVAGAMSASYQFLRGLSDGGATGLDDAAILAEVWGEEAATRDETESWLFAYLLMSYRPLADEDLTAYIAFSESPAGQALNAALFAGFDVLYRAISYELGVGLARALAASDI